MSSFPLFLYNHVANVFEYNKIKYQSDSVAEVSLQSVFRAFLFYFFLLCILHTFLALLYYRLPLSFATFSALLLSALHYNFFLLLYLLTSIIHLFGISLFSVPFPTFDARTPARTPHN